MAAAKMSREAMVHQLSDVAALLREVRYWSGEPSPDLLDEQASKIEEIVEALGEPQVFQGRV